MKRLLQLLIVGLLVSATSALAQAGSVSITAGLTESLTVTVTSGSTINFTLSPNTAVNSGSATTAITTTWVLKPGRTKVQVWAYFSSATQALLHQTAGNATDITSSMVKIQVGGAGLFNPVTQTGPAGFGVAGSALQIGPDITITAANKNGFRNDTLAYQIDTTLATQLQADNYTGTLNIQAQATP
jgi:hypothetical protein